MYKYFTFTFYISCFLLTTATSLPVAYAQSRIVNILKNNCTPKKLFLLSSAAVSATTLIYKYQDIKNFLEFVPPTNLIKESSTHFDEQSKKIIRMNNFVVYRAIEKYEKYFGPEFSKKLYSLTSNDHIMDSGAGEGRALKEYWEKMNGTGPKMTVVSYFMTPRAKKFFQGTKNVKSFTEQYLENIPKENLIKEFGHVNFMIDVFGVLSYSSQPHQVLNSYLDILDQNGEIYIYMGNNFENTVHLSPNKSITFRNWISLNETVEVKEIGQGIVLKKKSSSFKPYKPLLIESIDESGRPPYKRVYSSINRNL